MKPDIHPEYREVVFLDTSSGDQFLTRSTIATSETVEFEGSTYPLAKVEISSASHPFFTGQMKIVDTAGRVERFERRYGRRGKQGAGDDAADGAVDEALAEETPADETPVAEEAPVEDAAAEETPTDAETDADGDDAAEASDD